MTPRQDWDDRDRVRDRVRGFPAFPASRRRPGRFARSWWGNAWITALEDTALDQRPLKQGRKHAHSGQVGPITVSPGRIGATVHDHEDDTSYRTAVFLDQLGDVEWDRFLDRVAARAGHLAALLDRDMPHDLVRAAEDAGVRLLPGIGDLEPECDCPDWELPCRHAAALCYQVSWLLDADPFVLLLMRGRGERELLDDLQRRNAARGEAQLVPAPVDLAVVEDPATPTGAPAGASAREAYQRDVPPLPEPPTTPPPPATPLSVPPAPDIDPAGLAVLVADAALRARELLRELERGVGDDAVGTPAPLDLWQDTVRLAATHRDPAVLDRLRRASGRGAELDRAARAWEYGGPAGLDTLEVAWAPPKEVVARARAVVGRLTRDGSDGVDGVDGGDAGDTGGVRVWRNRWTLDKLGLQLRYGRDGRWHPYRRESGDWWPAAPARRDPVAALAELDAE
ncbi:putative conserved protein, contains Zn finger domain [Streptoalloteichus tenebrarius]|uniref:Conserved protein, contains Zn finger domain n=1 Tax=Streptoalloteichus tenebrarius (strain ATCC 17920 / DSM 40477 / JCM 4838 / CBS 697.72 / NBRC 16177 / NCIMB 11028 / NRRL B-12390 / A12253. 1 / ISP 5477) TaxID=1933 RepID=A0ABT1HRZ0_STRSD|nr:SWIM zinc finger family protein [Streptoalloteichus tenebrarius]MCP2258288.1 putative conserved protein, contains Zn finger domain [Streptoalloteichus tenebrarius]BFF04479.1 hypothetical protein GCM10020241_61540 [Streptoalloteichus tenebrarius]